jgi:hypothetical protein
MIDFNTIYEKFAPIVGTGTFATFITVALAIAYKVFKICKKAENTFTSTQALTIDAFKKAIPKELYVSVETLAKSELSKLKTEIMGAINENWLKQISSNTELTKAIAVALMSIKSIPDSSKEAIANLINISKPDTTESLKVDLIPIQEAETSAEKPLLD